MERPLVSSGKWKWWDCWRSLWSLNKATNALTNTGWCFPQRPHLLSVSHAADVFTCCPHSFRDRSEVSALKWLKTTGALFRADYSFFGGPVHNVVWGLLFCESGVFFLFFFYFLFICFNTKKYIQVTIYTVLLKQDWILSITVRPSQVSLEVFRQVSRQTTSSCFSLFILSITTLFWNKRERIRDLRHQVLVQDCPKCFGTPVTWVLVHHDEVLADPIRHTQYQFSQSVSLFFFFFQHGAPWWLLGPLYILSISTLWQENSQKCPKP